MKTLFCWSLIFALTVPLSAADSDFKPLFNGKNLDGWINVNCAPETWSAKDGVIYCTGKPIGELRTTRQYENFVLELEWRHLKSGGNAGVFVWAGPIGAKGVPFLRAVEVQVLDHGYITPSLNKSYTTHGDIFPIHGSKMKPFGPSNGMRSFPSEKHSKGSPEWNHYRIECNNGTVWLWVNGHKVSGGEDCDWRKGYIALESEGSPVEFRNLRVKELPSSGAKPEMSAPEYEGHRTLYTGTDLRGWKFHGEGEKRWISSDWRLTNKGGESPGQSLWSTERFDDFELIFDCRSNAKESKGAIAEVSIRGNAGNQIAIPIATKKLDGYSLTPKQPVDLKRWNRYKVVAKGKQVRLFLNDDEVATGTLPGAASSNSTIGLIDHGHHVEFANLYVRKLE